MLRAVKKSKLLSCVLSLTVLVGFAVGFDTSVFADGNTAHVKSAEEMTEALADENVDHIIIDEGFDVPCMTASIANGTSYFTVNRNMIIEGADADVTLKRTIAEGASNGNLQSIIGIRGNGNYDGIEVSMFKLTLDGGADFGTNKGTSRMNMSASSAGVAGRALVDVYYKATLNLENGVTIQNSFTTCSMTSLTGSTGSNNYGGAVRVDWETESGGGTVNVKAGSCIRNCVVNGGYGGAIGAYSYARLNVYGGLIENCSAHYGGAVGCTWRASHNGKVAGTFRMYGGVIRNCSANQGGAISADGADNCINSLYGGTIDNCTASGLGGALALGGSGDGIPTLNITPYSENGALVITNCTSGRNDTDPDTTYGGKPLGYSGVYLGGSNSPINIAEATYSVAFKKYKDDKDVITTLTVNSGEALGESFPADPVDEENSYTFCGWNSKPDGTGTTITEDSEINENMTLYARWACLSATAVSDEITVTYGDTDSSISVNVDAPYGGNISYQWVTYSPEADTLMSGKGIVIDGATSDTYTIPVSDAGRYMYSCKIENAMTDTIKVSTEVKIEVVVEPKTVDLKWSELEFTADGKNKCPVAEIQGLVEGDDVSVTITGAKSEVGTFVADAKLVGDDAKNYVIAEGQDFVNFTIKAAPTPTVTPTTEPTATPKPTATTRPTVTSKPTITSNPTVTAKPTGSVSADPTATATPIPSPVVMGDPDPTGGATITPEPTDVVNDPTPSVTSEPASDPKAQTLEFVNRIYMYVLDREPEAEGAAFWSDELWAFRRTGAEVAQGFIFSPEFESRGTTDEQFVTILYKTFFGRDPEEGGMKYWLEQLSTGTMDRVAVANGFIFSQEWADTCASYGIRSGGDLKPTGTIEPTELTYAFVERMYTTAMQRDYDESGRQYWAGELANFNVTGELVGASFFLSEEMENYKLSDKEFLGRLYATFMDRESDADGEAYWLGVMASGATRSDVVFGFTRSPEFTEKCIEARILPF